VSSGSLWLAMKNLHCQQLLPSNDYWWQNNKQKTLLCCSCNDLGVRKLVRLLKSFVVTSYKCPVNLIINPNPMSSH
jgi:hypothetical protein